MARKGRLFEKEAKRVVNQNYHIMCGIGRVPHATQRSEEAIRRAMVRAYHKGRKDGEDASWKDVDSQRGLEDGKK